MYNGYTVTLAIPTLSRYDLLDFCIASASKGIVKPDKYIVIDNGGLYTYEGRENVEVISYGYNIGVAKSWNYFINNVPEIRIISNDDIQFYPETIKELVDGYNFSAITSLKIMGGFNTYSLYIFPDSLKPVVGLFDESISPNYAYYEDNDFAYRMGLVGHGSHLIENVRVGHFGSATLRQMNPTQMTEHHKKFRLAQSNYINKWGGLPGEEKFRTPYNS